MWNLHGEADRSLRRCFHLSLSTGIAGAAESCTGKIVCILLYGRTTHPALRCDGVLQGRPAIYRRESEICVGAQSVGSWGCSPRLKFTMMNGSQTPHSADVSIQKLDLLYVCRQQY
jgi:hypothetical protein